MSISRYITTSPVARFNSRLVRCEVVLSDRPGPVLDSLQRNVQLNDSGCLCIPLDWTSLEQGHSCPKKCLALSGAHSLSVCLSVYLSIYLCMHPTTHLSVVKATYLYSSTVLVRNIGFQVLR